MNNQATRPTGAGLTSDQAHQLLQEHGPNALKQAQQTPAMVILLRQFTSLLVVILIAASVIAVAFGEFIDAIAISMVVLLNGALGFVQEWRSENALNALQNMLASNARVLRDGVERLIDTRDIVPGDLVILSAGDKVPADMTIMTSAELRVDESVLTGESFPVEKDSVDPEALLFMGTAVVAGRAEGVVCATASKTEFGKIADLTGSVERKPTHLQIKLAQLAKQLGVVAIGAASLVGIVGLVAGKPPSDMFMTALSLAVAVVPEGLPAVVTITLAVGASAMVGQKALARRLQAVETLGAATVICSDKTGTMTEDQMTAAKVWLSGRHLTVTGTGYDPTGHIEEGGTRLRTANDADLAALLETALLCNHAKLNRIGDHWQMVGEPTEGALITLAYKGWAQLPADNQGVAELPFSSDRKRMSILAKSVDGYVLHVKGAPEVVLDRCSHVHDATGLLSIDDDIRQSLTQAYEGLAAQGLRVLALARRSIADSNLPPDEHDLELLGFIGLIDPPRAEVRDAIVGCKSAGIQVVMITGDNPLTARSIAEDLGIKVNRVVTGASLEAMSDADLDQAIADNPHCKFSGLFWFGPYRVSIYKELNEQKLGHPVIFQGKNFAISVNTPSVSALEAAVKKRFHSGQGFALATMNVDHLVKLANSKEFAEAYSKQDLIVADGNPIVWLAKLSGIPVDLIAGSDQTIPLIRWATECGVPVAFVGSPDEVLSEASKRLEHLVPSAKVVARISPPYGFDPAGELAGHIIEEINASGAKLCIVALGAPKQEIFSALGRERAPTVGFASFGAGIDFIAGHQMRAPRWVRKLAMEWLWRMLSNPKRLLKRYVECALVLPGHTLSALAQRQNTDGS